MYVCVCVCLFLFLQPAPLGKPLEMLQLHQIEVIQVMNIVGNKYIW